ncbi:unnamed protein product [Parnassius apollo]|uniref:(apollo) hypothetical protein n=1 Tax=Parnassius apollo TaxID=110799 RepID=A0A8S3XA56_PARAO|nr:unnamed protein product [Parnassius apollo]
MWSRFKKLMAVINENGAEKENINKENIQPDKDELGNDARISQRILVKSLSIFSGSNSSSSSFMADTMNSPKQQLVIIRESRKTFSDTNHRLFVNVSDGLPKDDQGKVKVSIA